MAKVSLHQVQNWFLKFCSEDTLLRNQDTFRELVECNLRKSTQELALDLNISQSTICCHFKKIGKKSKAGCLGSS